MVEVSDDGPGGAQADAGSGLRGLADRVASVGGALQIDSPSGRGTRLKAEIPCQLPRLARHPCAWSSPRTRSCCARDCSRVLTEAGMDVAGTAADAERLLHLVSALRPQVVLADVRMPPTQTTEGLQAARQIRRQWPGTAVVVLSQHVETEHLFELLADDPRGVGYVLKERVADITQFTAAIRRVAAGESVIDPEVVSRLVGDDHGTTAPWRS